MEFGKQRDNRTRKKHGNRSDISKPFDYVQPKNPTESHPRVSTAQGSANRAFVLRALANQNRNTSHTSKSNPDGFHATYTSPVQRDEYAVPRNYRRQPITTRRTYALPPRVEVTRVDSLPPEVKHDLTSHIQNAKQLTPSTITLAHGTVGDNVQYSSSLDTPIIDRQPSKNELNATFKSETGDKINARSSSILDNYATDDDIKRQDQMENKYERLGSLPSLDMPEKSMLSHSKGQLRSTVHLREPAGDESQRSSSGYEYKSELKLTPTIPMACKPTASVIRKELQSKTSTSVSTESGSDEDSPEPNAEVRFLDTVDSEPPLNVVFRAPTRRMASYDRSSTISSTDQFNEPFGYGTPRHKLKTKVKEKVKKTGLLHTFLHCFRGDEESHSNVPAVKIYSGSMGGEYGTEARNQRSMVANMTNPIIKRRDSVPAERGTHVIVRTRRTRSVTRPSRIYLKRLRTIQQHLHGLHVSYTNGAEIFRNEVAELKQSMGVLSSQMETMAMALGEQHHLVEEVNGRVGTMQLNFSSQLASNPRPSTPGTKQSGTTGETTTGANTKSNVRVPNDRKRNEERKPFSTDYFPQAEAGGLDEARVTSSLARHDSYTFIPKLINRKQAQQDIDLIDRPLSAIMPNRKSVPQSPASSGNSERRKSSAVRKNSLDDGSNEANMGQNNSLYSASTARMGQGDGLYSDAFVEQERLSSIKNVSIELTEESVFDINPNDLLSSTPTSRCSSPPTLPTMIEGPPSKSLTEVPGLQRYYRLTYNSEEKARPKISTDALKVNENKYLIQRDKCPAKSKKISSIEVKKIKGRSLINKHSIENGKHTHVVRPTQELKTRSLSNKLDINQKVELTKPTMVRGFRPLDRSRKQRPISPALAIRRSSNDTVHCFGDVADAKEVKKSQSFLVNRKGYRRVDTKRVWASTNESINELIKRKHGHVDCAFVEDGQSARSNVIFESKNHGHEQRSAGQSALWTRRETLNTLVGSERDQVTRSSRYSRRNVLGKVNGDRNVTKWQTAGESNNNSIPCDDISTVSNASFKGTRAIDLSQIPYTELKGKRGMDFHFVTGKSTSFQIDNTTVINFALPERKQRCERGIVSTHLSARREQERKKLEARMYSELARIHKPSLLTRKDLLGDLPQQNIDSRISSDESGLTENDNIQEYFEGVNYKERRLKNQKIKTDEEFRQILSMTEEACLQRKPKPYLIEDTTPIPSEDQRIILLKNETDSSDVVEQSAENDYSSLDVNENRKCASTKSGVISKTIQSTIETSTDDLQPEKPKVKNKGVQLSTPPCNPISMNTTLLGHPVHPHCGYYPCASAMYPQISMGYHPWHFNHHYIYPEVMVAHNCSIHNRVQHEEFIEHSKNATSNESSENESSSEAPEDETIDLSSMTDSQRSNSTDSCSDWSCTNEPFCQKQCTSTIPYDAYLTQNSGCCQHQYGSGKAIRFGELIR